MTKILRVGVIGLGRRWRKRYQPALRALQECFQVRVLYDQVQQLAQAEAQRLGCDAVVGVAALVERDDVDVLLLADPQWFGLWPLEQACRFGKPVLCCPSLAVDPGHAEALCRQVKESGLAVLVELTPRLAQATERLRHLLEAELGPPRLVTVHATLRETGVAAAIPLIDWCFSLIGQPPIRVVAAEAQSAGLLSVLWECPGGRAVHLVRQQLPGNRPAVRMEVLADRGRATIRLPNRLTWSTEQGRFGQVLRPVPLGRLLLERFYQAATEGRPPQPSLNDAHQALSWWRAALQGQTEGHAIST